MYIAFRERDSWWSPFHQGDYSPQAVWILAHRVQVLYTIDQHCGMERLLDLKLRHEVAKVRTLDRYVGHEMSAS
jgi:hypothetical protein